MNEFSLLKILPPNLAADSKLNAMARALDAELRQISADSKQVLHLPRLDELSHEVLDALAWSFDCPFYEPENMDLDTKRKIISTTLLQHFKLGTPYAVRKLLDVFSKGAKVQEWFEYGGRPYHFKLKLQRLQDLGDEGETIMRLIEIAKNVRSWLDAFDFDLSRQHPDEILHVAFTQVLLGRIYFDLSHQLNDFQKMQLISTGLVTGKIFYRQNSENKNARKLYSAFVHLIFGEIRYICRVEATDDLWYSLFLNWVRSRFKKWQPAEIFWDVEDIDAPDEEDYFFSGNWLELYLDFHNSDEQRILKVAEPLDNLSGKQINAVNVDGIFKSRRGFFSNKIFMAQYVRKNEVKFVL